MVGVLIGSPVFGFLSDYVGRKKSLLLALTTVAVAPTVAALMPTAAGFGFFRFLSGNSYILDIQQNMFGFMI